MTELQKPFAATQFSIRRDKEMKRWITLLLALVMCLSLCACGGGEEKASEKTKATKEELLAEAAPLTKADAEKAIDNVAFAESLEGKTYTFDGVVESVASDHAVVSLQITDEEGTLAISSYMMVAHVFLPKEDLTAMEAKQGFSFVGTLEKATTEEQDEAEYGTDTQVVLTFDSAAIVSDRFEDSGKLHSQNKSYGDDAWNIQYPGKSVLSVVHFSEDVSDYVGQEITFSYKIVDGSRVDAKIVP